MEQCKIIWHTKAYQRYSGIISWYGMNCGISYAQSFIEDVDKNLKILSRMPTIGNVIRVVGEKHYAQFVLHPKMIIRYWFDDKEIHIVDFKPTMTK